MGADLNRTASPSQALRVEKAGLSLREFWLRAAILLLLTAASCAFYLLYSHAAGGIGFPLDDAWIHQTYARNLAINREWAFISGEPSAGSTAPLWSASLAIGHLLGLAPFTWTYLLGLLCLWAISLMGMWVFDRMHPANPGWSLAMGAFLALEWHLVWAAVSGMETLLAALLTLLVIALLLPEQPPWFWLGALVGLSVWIRPDGITLIGPVGLVAVAAYPGWKTRLRALVLVGVGFLFFFVPYLFFNRSISGDWWPNTLFAKQAEYAVELESGLPSRLAEQALLPLVGAGVLLLPGFLYALYLALQKRDWAILAGAIWVTGYLAMFALRLPVSYQHGRYAMPAMPVYFVLGLSGLFEIVRRSSSWRSGRLISRAWLLSTVLLSLGFLVLGAGAYQRDVRVVNEEMVSTAYWLTRNTEEDALIAVHDIGAIGYYGGRRLIDLAGLVSPQVIPIIRDEAALARYLDDQGAGYLVTFPGWYPELAAHGSPVYISSGKVSPALGGENMVVYRWRSDP